MILCKTLVEYQLFKIFQNYYFNKTLIDKKNNLKRINAGFIKELYLYLSSSAGGNDLSPSLEELYNKYIELVNWNLNFNKEEIDLYRNGYFYRIQMDYLKYQRTTKYSFIYLNEEDKILKLEAILDRIREFAVVEEYFSFKEFQDFINEYRSAYLSVVEIDKFKNVGKIPKRLKTRKRIIYA